MTFTFTICTGMCFPLRVIFLIAFIGKMRRVTTPTTGNRWAFLFLTFLIPLAFVTFVAVVFIIIIRIFLGV